MSYTGSGLEDFTDSLNTSFGSYPGLSDNTPAPKGWFIGMHIETFETRICLILDDCKLMLLTDYFHKVIY